MNFSSTFSPESSSARDSQTVQQLLSMVNQALSQLPMPCQPAGLYEPIRYVLSLGGKRIRPLFLLLSYGLYRSDIETAMPAALGIETYHNFTLLHDDLMDHADVRRGKPTVHCKWDPNTAILSGDSMLLLAMKLIQGVPAQFAPELMKVFVDSALEIDEGQQYDVNFESRLDVTEEEYLEMIRLKTSVLLGCAAKMGAILARASVDDARLLYGFGEKVGLAFQLQDDYLDVYGDAKLFGKRIGGDILCNKKTFLLISALRMADDGQLQQLLGWLNQPNPDAEQKIQAVTSLYDALGIGPLCQQRVAQYFSEARQLLEQVSLPADRKATLWSFASSLFNRAF